MNMYHVRQNYRDIDVAIAGCGSGRHRSGQRAGQWGFSLVELLIAMAIGMIILSGVYGVFWQQQKQFSKQEVAVEMQQNARMAMDIMTRDIRMAGYNPPNPASTLTKCSGLLTSSSTTCIGIRNATANSISFASDLDGDGDLTADTTNPNENIVYDRYSSSGIYSLGRTSNGSKQPVIENLDYLEFIYYSDAIGTLATKLEDIRMIRVTIRVKASKADPLYTTNSGFRTYTLVSDIKPRNLGL